jgi:predicted PhzF superfamily epimerase YddE/YHI9
VSTHIPYFHVDAFTSATFGGNPAGVCLLQKWLPEATLQSIAAENNLSETAFLVGQGTAYELRWFTPEVEVDLCGHATLASAFVLFKETEVAGDALTFKSRSGLLRASRRDDLIELDFPSRPPASCVCPVDLLEGLRLKPREVLKSRDYLAIYDSPEEVASLKPDMHLLASLDSLGVIVTAKGGDADFVSRFFAPGAGIPEDPVTGSAHCTLIPYWARSLGKSDMFARQISKRGGELHCRLLGDRVGIAGRATLYSRGEILV